MYVMQQSCILIYTYPLSFWFKVAHAYQCHTLVRGPYVAYDGVELNLIY